VPHQHDVPRLGRGRRVRQWLELREVELVPRRRCIAFVCRRTAARDTHCVLAAAQPAPPGPGPRRCGRRGEPGRCRHPRVD
jgi:hypothetical protein